MRRILVVVILAAVAYAVLNLDTVSSLLVDRPLLADEETRVLSTVLDYRFDVTERELGIAEVVRGLVVGVDEVGRGGAATLDTDAVAQAAQSYRERNETLAWLPADFAAQAPLRILGEGEYGPLLAPGGARAVAQAEVGVLTEIGPMVYLSRPGFDAQRTVAVVSLVDLKAIPAVREWFWLERAEGGWAVAP